MVQYPVRLLATLGFALIAVLVCRVLWMYMHLILGIG